MDVAAVSICSRQLWADEKRCLCTLGVVGGGERGGNGEFVAVRIVVLHAASDHDRLLRVME